MKRELLIAGVATTLVVGLAGCAEKEEGSPGDNRPGTPTDGAPPPTEESPTPTTPAPGSANVTVDGQPRNFTGPVVCETNAGSFSIAIGEPLTGIIVGIEPDGSVVRGVGLGEVNGVMLSFTEGVPGNEASATKDGNNYKIKGTATGLDEAGATVSKPFEIDVTCP